MMPVLADQRSLEHPIQGLGLLIPTHEPDQKFEADDSPPLPAGVPRIEVTFLIDANGILNVKASDMRTGQSQSIEVKPSYGLADGEVERIG